MARYEWKHDAGFNAVVSDSLREIDVRGAFDGCPIPTLIIEGKWDLTWDTDKPAILHKNHPNARLVVLEQSGHVPYDDQPEEFFAVLQDYVVNLPQVAPDDLHRWAVHLSKWKEEKEKEDPFLVEEMSKAEARAIEDFRRKREQILAGATYQDTSTPLDAYLTLLSAAHSGDTDALKRVLAVDTEKMTVMVGADATSMMMAGVKDYVFEVDVLRAPVPPRDPEHGTIWPVYVTKAKEASLADTFLLVFWNGEWAWCGNMASPMKWRPALPQFKAVLKRFGK